MLRLDTHKYNCSFYKARNSIVRDSYRRLFSLDPYARLAAAQTIEAEAELLGSCQGRTRHPCRTCRHISRMRIAGIQAFLQNFNFSNFTAEGERVEFHSNPADQIITGSQK